MGLTASEPAPADCPHPHPNRGRDRTAVPLAYIDCLAASKAYFDCLPAAGAYDGARLALAAPAGDAHGHPLAHASADDCSHPSDTDSPPAGHAVARYDRHARCCCTAGHPRSADCDSHAGRSERTTAHLDGRSNGGDGRRDRRAASDN